MSSCSTIHLALAFVALAGCDLGILDPIITAGHTSDSSDTGVTVTSTGATSGDPDPETTGEPPLTTASSTAGDSDSDSDSGTNFIIPPDPLPECNMWTQDCPPAEKCSAGGPPPLSENSIACFPIVPNPAHFGEECEILLEGELGPDTCDIGLFCHDVDPETGKGTCVELCQGTEWYPMCDAGFTCLLTAVPLCIPECEPLLQNCAGNQSCVYLADTFACSPAPDEPKELFESCESLNECDPGLVCAGPEVAVECDHNSLGCCTFYCELGGPDFCPGVGQECRPFFAPGDTPPGHENVGICALP